MRTPSLLTAVLLSTACGPGTAGPSARPSTALAPPAASASAAAAAPASTIRFEPRPGPVLRAEETASSLPRLAIKKPGADEIVEPANVSNLSIEVDAELSRLGPDAGIEVSLDGQRPRRIQDRAIALSALVPIERDLPVGEHFLVAAAADADGRLIRTHNGKTLSASVRFWLGSKGAGGAAPKIVCWGPNGTYYGESAEPALDVLLAPESEPQAAVVANVAGLGVTAASRIDAAQPWGILGLMSGDYRVVVELEQPGGTGLRDDCSFTLNRETERGGT